MGWGTLLTVLVVGCPPTRVVYGPEFVCLPAAPAPVVVYEVPYCVQTIPSSAMALVPVPVEPPTTTAAVVQDNAKDADAPVTEAVKATEDDDSVLEDAAFGMAGFGGQRSLDHLSLGWGVSTIGNGTLYPTPTSAGYTGGFGGFGGGRGNSEPLAGTNTGSNWNMINNVLPPITIICPCAPPAVTNTPPGNPGQVPEPTSLAAWSAAAIVAGLLRRRAMA